MESLFFYGTLVDLDMLHTVIGRSLKNLRPVSAVLDGYKAVLVAAKPYPGLKAAPGARTHGILVSGVTPAEIARLIRYEEREMYGIEAMTVRSDDGMEHVAKVFMPRRRVRLSQKAWNLTEWQRRHKRDYLARTAESY